MHAIAGTAILDFTPRFRRPPTQSFLDRQWHLSVTVVLTPHADITCNAPTAHLWLAGMPIPASSAHSVAQKPSLMHTRLRRSLTWACGQGAMQRVSSAHVVYQGTPLLVLWVAVSRCRYCYARLRRPLTWAWEAAGGQHAQGRLASRCAVICQVPPGDGG